MSDVFDERGIILKGGQLTKDRRLDRIVQFDEKSKEYPIRPLLRAAGATKPRSYTWSLLGSPVLDQGREGACFPAGTMIRLADGSQKPIETIRLLDEVVTAEGRTGRVLQTMVRRSDEMLVVDFRGHAKIQMTPEHPVLTRRGYVAAKDLTPEDRVAITRHNPQDGDPIDVWSIIDASEFRGVAEGKILSGGVETMVAPVPSLLGRTADLGRLLGLYAAEGHTTVNKVVWSFGGHEEDTLVANTVTLIKSCFDAQPRVQHRPNGAINVVLYGKLWRRLFAALVPGTSKHGDKRLSPEVTRGPTLFRQNVLVGWLDGDGHRRRTAVEGVTVCKALALDMHAIANDLGMRPVLNWSLPSKNRHAATRQTRWSVTISDGGGANVPVEDNAAVWRKVTSVEPVEFSGWVYNFHVEGDESYVADGLGVHNCVGFAWAHELAARPIAASDVTNDVARQIYHEAQRLDEWPGEGYSGTSVLAGAKAVTAGRHIKEYRWAFNLSDLVLAVGYKGPVVLGLPWYGSMYETYTTDGPSRVRVDGSLMGGHAILCVGVNVKARYLLLLNSWGAEGWGYQGRAWISFEDMERLLAERGEACIPIDRRRT